MNTVRVAQHTTFGDYTPSRQVRIENNLVASTIVVDNIPDRQYWLEQFASPDFLADLTKHRFTVRVGIARCNPLDHFSRKEGIKRAQECTRELELHPVAIQLHAEGRVQLSCKAYNGSVISFDLVGGRGQLRFYDAELYNFLYPRTDTEPA